MSKTKQELEQAIVMHEEALESSKHSVIVDTQDLEQAKKDLADVNKPELTPSQLDDIHEAIEESVSEFDFSDQDNYNTEFELDYDNKVTLSELELCNHEDLVEAIVEKISLLFVETIDDEEGNKGPGSAEDSNHPVEKLQN